MRRWLKSKIKSNNRKSRYAAIDELVKIADREAISTLIYIAKGLKRSRLRYYDFEDQVYAHKALLSTRDKVGIDFLKSFFEETTRISERPPICNITLYIPKLTLKEHLFKKASGELGRRLYYTELLPEKLEKKSNKNDIIPDDWFILNTIVNKNKETHRFRDSILNRIKFLTS